MKTSEALHLLLKGNEIDSIELDDQDELQKYNQYAEAFGYFKLLDSGEQCSPDIWLIPEDYKNFDIEFYLKLKANTPEKEERINYELALFKERNMYDVLRLLKYIVDKMREHNKVWGVGRGSSVSSYCLFLLGVHKIDSIKYNLDIHEFLK